LSYRYEFAADIESSHLLLPPEIASRLRAHGLHRVRVVLTSMAEDEALLAERGIDSSVIDRTAATQRIDRDVATVLLACEGMAADRPLAQRLADLTVRS
jgi:hypothetical protein